jgi:hypothetical protein
MPATAVFRKRPTGARCKRHGLVLVDEGECALCKQSRRPKPTSPWLIASLGGVVLAVLFGVRWLGEREATHDTSDAPRAARPTSVSTKVERSRPAFERSTSRSERDLPAASAPARRALEPAAALADPAADKNSLPVEDRQLGQPSPTLEPATQAKRPPDAPSTRGFPATPRQDDPADFD